MKLELFKSEESAYEKKVPISEINNPGNIQVNISVRFTDRSSCIGSVHKLHLFSVNYHI